MAAIKSNASDSDIDMQKDANSVTTTTNTTFLKTNDVTRDNSIEVLQSSRNLSPK